MAFSMTAFLKTIVCLDGFLSEDLFCVFRFSLLVQSEESEEPEEDDDPDESSPDEDDEEDSSSSLSTTVTANLKTTHPYL